MTYTTFYKDKVILVTGGAGAIGVNLVAALAALQAKKIIVLDNLSSSYIWNFPDKENILFIKGDIRNDDDLRVVFHHQPTVIFHLAAYFANQRSVDYPLINESVNTTGILKLLEYAIISGKIERFVYTNSSGGAYGSENKLPYKENDTSLRLSSPYYISKMSAEAYCYYYHQTYNLPVTVLRLFNSYGPGEVPGMYRNVIPNFIYWALQKRTLPLTGDKRQARDFTYVLDTVEGLLRAGHLQEAIGESINIAGGTEIFIHELAELINKKTGNLSGIKMGNQRKWDTRPKVRGSSLKCEEILKFKPSNKIETGIDSCINWFENNWANIEKSAEFYPGINPALDVI